jgi:hypothetical protein
VAEKASVLAAIFTAGPMQRSTWSHSNHVANIAINPRGDHQHCSGLPTFGSENGGQYRSFLRHIAASFGYQKTQTTTTTGPLEPKYEISEQYDHQVGTISNK